MGQFSWLYSDTGRQMVDGKKKNSYLLVPPPFQDKYGEHILEKKYDGYGHFGDYDVYELVAEWNKESVPEILRRAERGSWECSINENTKANLMKLYRGEPISCELRWLGIVMACYDSDNAALEYPIKIVSYPMPYERAKASESDPDQGWE